MVNVNFNWLFSLENDMENFRLKPRQAAYPDASFFTKKNKVTMFDA